MISQCPHCNQNLRFSDANKERILIALGKLPQGQTLKFKCPICKEVIELNSNGSNVDSGLNSDIEIEPKPKQKYSNTIAVPPPTPPNAPDISWLISGTNTDANVVEDVQTAMVLALNQSMVNSISETLKAESYQIYTPLSIDEAISSIRFKDYAVIVYHSQYEDKPLKLQDFHKFMQQMSMQKRRYIYYILIGPQFHTLYDLEALANSANLVINDNELKFFPTILAKGTSDYKKLFKPYISMLKVNGKS